MAVPQPKLFVTWSLALGGLDVWVALVSADTSAEAVNWAKIFGVLLFQVLALVVLLSFTDESRISRHVKRGSYEEYRHRSTPNFIFAMAIGVSLLVLYNAIACGEQSFRMLRHEPICKAMAPRAAQSNGSFDTAAQGRSFASLWSFPLIAGQLRR